MKDFLIAAMPGEEAPAARLAALTGASSAAISVRAFPDREHLVTAPRAESNTVIYCSLNQPDEKLLLLLFAASALRDQGARRVILIAPYLAYMRQDRAFNAGEAVSQRVVARLLAEAFDETFTLEPHLHRTARLDDLFGAGKAIAVGAAPLLGEMIARRLGAKAPGDLLVVGPDEESAPWTEAVAGKVGAPWLVMKKRRESGTKVVISLDENADIKGKAVCLVDDIASSGGTLMAATRVLRAHGAASINAFVVHAMMRGADLAAVKDSGVDAVFSTDSIRHETNAIEVAPLLAREVIKRLDA
jgi:ribose-phosphate pyrophosphokinase